MKPIGLSRALRRQIYVAIDKHGTTLAVNSALALRLPFGSKPNTRTSTRRSSRPSRSPRRSALAERALGLGGRRARGGPGVEGDGRGTTVDVAGAAAGLNDNINMNIGKTDFQERLAKTAGLGGLQEKLARASENVKSVAARLSGLADTARGVRGAAADGSLKAAPAKLVGGLLDEYGAEARRIDATTRDVAAKVATDKNLKGSLEIGAKLGAATTEAAATAGTISGINEARLDGSLKDAVSDTLAASADAVKREAERQARRRPSTSRWARRPTSAPSPKSVTAASKIAGAATEGAGAVVGTADAVKHRRQGRHARGARARRHPDRQVSAEATTTVKPCARGACPARAHPFRSIIRMHRREKRV